MTKDRLKEELNLLGVEYAEDAKKEELEALLDEHAPQDAESEDSTNEEETPTEEAPVEHLAGSLVAQGNLKVDGIAYKKGDLYSGAEVHKEHLLKTGVLKQV